MVIARYTFRHEAEFAAGFLEDAGIPYRLQLDDPAMGLTVSAPATIWVRGIDVPRAREILELEDRGRPGPTPAPPTPHAPGALAQAHDRGRVAVRLSVRARLLAGVLGTGAAAVAVVSTGAAAETLVIALEGAAGAALLSVAATGRAPPILRDLLSALVGDAP